MEIGQAIRELRLGLKLPKGVFARNVCEVSCVTLRAIENNKKLPSGKVLDAIERNLGLPLSYLMFFALSDEDIKGVSLDAHKELRRRILGELWTKRDELLERNEHLDHSSIHGFQGDDEIESKDLDQGSNGEKRKLRKERNSAISTSRFLRLNDNAALASDGQESRENRRKEVFRENISLSLV